ncbi:hypothetical protein D3C76_165650 [compost metagenome]
MNAFSQAHAMTKEIIQPGDNYAATFALCLKHINQKAKTMEIKPEAVQYIETAIEDSKAYIARLEAFKATNPTGYIVVTGTARMPIVFDIQANTANVGNIQTANRWNDVRIAQAKGRQVQNGNGEKGQAVYVVDQIDWEIGQQNRLIADLTGALAKHK